jgi:HAMP domain-containing protein
MRSPCAAIVMGSAGWLSAVLAGAPLAAQEASGRYSMTATADGFLKLDSKTGAVSDCRREATGYQCRLVADERNALQAEIDRLVDENNALKDRLAAAGSAAKPDSRVTPPSPAVPSDEEIDRALGLMEKFMRRFKTFLREDPPKDDKPL